MAASREYYDLVVIGSGFGGSLTAMVARRIGLSVLLLERGSHPRFAIGESTSPLTNLLIEQIAERYDLSNLLPLTTYGQWQERYPEIVCGLKRGFSFFHHTQGQPFEPRHDRSNQLLVAASPSDRVSDTHWLRADADQFLMKEAVAVGAEYLDRVKPKSLARDDSGIVELQASRDDQDFVARARLFVDATGPRGFLTRALNIPESSFAGYPATQALFSHFSGVARCDSMPEFADPETPPYLIDDAALHHVFDGGWMWVLRFGNGVTSAGVAVTDEFARGIGLSDGEPAWRRFLSRFPSIERQFGHAEAIRPFTYTSRLSYRASAASGEGWAMLPSAAAFIDPLFSTGFPLTLLGIERLGRILEEHWGTSDLHEALSDYARITLEEADTVADLISACYAAMHRFEDFSALSTYYFAAASYSEMDRRLNNPRHVYRFLASDRVEFNLAMRQSCDSARAGVADEKRFAEQICAGVENLNVAGLCDPAKRNWYWIDLEDVVRGAEKLGLQANDVREAIKRADWARP